MIASEPVVQALPWLLALGVLLASVRLLLGLRRLPADARPRAWRTGLVLLGQCASAALLFLLLRTSEPGDSIHTLHVLTAHAPDVAIPAPRRGERWLSLPEAGRRQGVDPTPDLATALRQHAQVSTLHVIGDGLQARDREAAAGMMIRFERAPLAAGIRDWWAPQSVQTGDILHVRGSAHGGARIDLLDPSGTRVDQQPLQADGRFSFMATTRSPGLGVYRLRLHDADGTQTASTQVSVEVLSTLPVRMVLRAGGADAELKFLRRWAADNGATLQASIALGGGLQAGDPPFALDARTLADADVLILDDRSWNGMGHASRETVLTSVANGMGLLLRATAPLADGDALGLQVRAANLPSSFTLPVAIGNDQTLPALTRPPLRIDNPAGHTLLRDDRGIPLAGWRAHGRGRIGIWLPTDSFRLALAGHADLHARLWADAINALTRARAPRPRDMPQLIYVDERVVFCALGDAARVLQPGDAAPLRLAIDPRRGAEHCAAFWPRREGWHRLIDGALDSAFLVHGRDADAVLQAARTQQATAALTGRMPAAPMPLPTSTTLLLPRWALFLLWLGSTSALWWFERSRLGRVRAAWSSLN